MGLTVQTLNDGELRVTHRTKLNDNFAATKAAVEQNEADIALLGAGLPALALNGNPILNGAFTVNQRSTAGNVTNNQFFTDGWVCMQGGAGFAATGGVSTLNPARDEFPNSLRVVCSAGGAGDTNDSYRVVHRMNGPEVARHINQTFTIGFLVRSAKTGIHSINIAQKDVSSWNYTAEFTVDQADTWEFKTITIVGGLPTDNSQVWVTDSGLAGLVLSWYLAAKGTYRKAAGFWSNDLPGGSLNQVNVLDTTGNAFQITGICINPGTEAIRFPHEPREITKVRALARYEEILPGRFTGLTYTPNGDSRSSVHFKIAKIKTPAITTSGTTSVIAFGRTADGNSISLGTLTWTATKDQASLTAIGNFAGLAGLGTTVNWADSGTGALTLKVDADFGAVT